MQTSPTKSNRQPRPIAVGPEYVSRKTAAAKLSCSVQLIAGLNKRGTLPMFRVGRAVRIKLTDLEAMLRSMQ